MKFRGLAVVAILLCVQTALFAQRDRISSSIDRSRIAVLSGNIHAKAQAQYDQGPADPFLAIENVTLRLKSSPEQQGLLDRLLAEQQDPSSANFHKWVTPEQYADRFGVSSGDMAKIISWLQAEGLKVNEVARSRHWISFSSTVGQAASASQ